MVYLAGMRSPGPSAAALRAAQLGDERATCALVATCGQIVDRAIHRLIVDPDDVKDIAQDTWIAVLRQLPTVRDHASFPAWLHKVAVNRALGRLRAEKRRRTAHERAGLAANFDVIERDPLLEIDVRRAIESLPPGMRTIVTHYLAGMTTGEIAQQMQIAPGTTKSQLHKARKKMSVVLRCTR